MTRALRASLVLLVLGAAAFADDSVRVTAPKLPAGVYSMIELASVDSLQKGVEGLVGAVAPGVNVPPLSMVKGLASRAFQGLPVQMISDKKPIRAFVGQNGFALCFGLDAPNTGASFLKALAQSGYKQGSKQGGLNVLYFLKTTFDSAAWRRAKPSERRNFSKFQKKVRQEVGVGVKGDVVVASLDKGLAGEVFRLVQSGAVTSRPFTGGGGQLGVVARLSALASGPQSPLQAAKAMAGMMSGGDRAKAAQIGAGVALAEAVFKEVEQVRLGIRVGTPGVRSTKVVTPTRGGLLDKLIRSTPSGRPKMLKYLPADTMAGAAFRLGDMVALYRAYADFARKIAAMTGQDPAAQEKMLKMGEEAIRYYGNDVSFAWRQAKGFSFVEAVAIKNEAALRKFLERYTREMDSMAPQMAKAGMQLNATYKRNAARLPGWTVDKMVIDFTMQPPPGGRVDPKLAQAMGMINIMKGLFLGPIHIAYSSDKLVAAVGTDTLPCLREVLSGKAGELVRQKKFSALARDLPRDRFLIGYASLTEIGNWVLGVAKDVAGPQAPAARFRKGPGLVFSGSKVRGGMQSDLWLPSAEIRNLVDGFKQISKQMRGSRRRHGRPPRRGKGPGRR